MKLNIDILNMIAKIENCEEISISEKTKIKILIEQLKNKEVNILIVGGTGVGKSSTINALFGEKTTEIGLGGKPQTMEIASYKLENLTIYDSPGLGDGIEKDKIHSKKIIDLLHKKRNDLTNEHLIDGVLVIMDASTRQIGDTVKLINEVILPNIDKKRVVIGINKIDAIQPKYWDSKNNCPTPELKEYVKKEIVTVLRERIKENTRIDIEPIYYTAGGVDFLTKKQDASYNLSKLLFKILEAMPEDRRIALSQKINSNEKVWSSNEETKENGNYQEKVSEYLFNTFIGIAEVFVPKAAVTVIKGIKGIWNFFFR